MVSGYRGGGGGGYRGDRRGGGGGYRGGDRRGNDRAAAVVDIYSTLMTQNVRVCLL